MIDGDKGTARFGDDLEVLDKCPLRGGESVLVRKVFPCTALTRAGDDAPLVGTWVGMINVKGRLKYDTKK